MAEAASRVEPAQVYNVADVPLKVRDLTLSLVLAASNKPRRATDDRQLWDKVNLIKLDLKPMMSDWKKVLGRSTFTGTEDETGAAYGVSQQATLLNAGAVMISLYGGRERFALRNHVGGDPGTGEMSSISTLSVITGVPWFGIESGTVTSLCRLIHDIIRDAINFSRGFVGDSSCQFMKLKKCLFNRRPTTRTSQVDASHCNVGWNQYSRTSITAPQALFSCIRLKLVPVPVMSPTS